MGKHKPLKPIIDYGKYDLSKLNVRLFSNKWAQVTCEKYELNAAQEYINVYWLPWDGLFHLSFEHKLKDKVADFERKMIKYNRDLEVREGIARRSMIR